MRTPPWIKLARWLLRHELALLEKQAEIARVNAQNCELQLAVARGLLATTMRERDNYETALDHVSYELARMKRLRRKERAAARSWITRTIARKSGLN